MSRSTVARVLKLSIVALLALAMPRSAGRGKVKPLTPDDDRQNEANPTAPL